MKQFLSRLAAAMLFAGAVASSHAAPTDLRMYRLDCGEMRLGDKSVMSDQGLYQGEAQDIVMSCYLIKHGDDWMLWDTGLPARYLAGPLTEGTFTTKLARTIVDQLRDLGLSANDIRYVAVSHAHFDHAGQVNDFPNATLIIQRAELDAIADTKVGAAHYIDAELFATHLTADGQVRVRAVEGDVDLFGDGTLKTVQTPGHTPGSMALLIDLKRAGPVVLSGDQWHFTENHERRQVPTWNYDHDDTIASGNKLDDIIARTGATLVIQHEPRDNRQLPVFPAYLD